MSRDEEVKASIEGRFPSLEGKVEIRRARRLFVTVPQDDFPAVMEHLRGTLGYIAISTITGLDEGENLAFLYHFNDLGKSVVTVVVKVPKSRPVICSITPTFPGAVFYERELVDLLGTVVEGLPPGDRYPLRDDWPAGQFPLRKDWKPEMLDGQLEEHENA